MDALNYVWTWCMVTDDSVVFYTKVTLLGILLVLGIIDMISNLRRMTQQND